MAALMAAAVLTAGCTKDRITFGTDAFWRLPPEEREGPTRAFLASQAQRARRLRAACLRLGTVQGALAARQFGLWADWAVRAEADPVAAEHVLTLWSKEYALARRQRRRAPRTVDELKTWLLARQNPLTGSWAHPEAPLWLAIGETGEALRILTADSMPELREPVVFLAIVHTPEAAAEVTARTLELASEAGLQQPIRHLAWLPWLRWVTRDLTQWAPDWDAAYRRFCASLLLDTATGGYRCVAAGAMDIAATYRFALGWNRGEEPLAWLPSPQGMAATIVAAASEVPDSLRAAAASLLVGSLADLDSTAVRRVCAVLNEWAQSAARDAEGAYGPAVVDAVEVLSRIGVGNDASHQWRAQFGCAVIVPDPSVLLARLRAGTATATLCDLEARALAARLERAARW